MLAYKYRNLNIMIKVCTRVSCEYTAACDTWLHREGFRTWKILHCLVHCLCFSICFPHIHLSLSSIIVTNFILLIICKIKLLWERSLPVKSGWTPMILPIDSYRHLTVFFKNYLSAMFFLNPVTLFFFKKKNMIIAFSDIYCKRDIFHCVYYIQEF